VAPSVRLNPRGGQVITRCITQAQRRRLAIPSGTPPVKIAAMAVAAAMRAIGLIFKTIYTARQPDDCWPAGRSHELGFLLGGPAPDVSGHEMTNSDSSSAGWLTPRNVDVTGKHEAVPRGRNVSISGSPSFPYIAYTRSSS
jgi:hypothetical protein